MLSKHQAPRGVEEGLEGEAWGRQSRWKVRAVSRREVTRARAVRKTGG